MHLTLINIGYFRDFGVFYVASHHEKCKVFRRIYLCFLGNLTLFYIDCCIAFMLRARIISIYIYTEDVLKLSQFSNFFGGFKPCISPSQTSASLRPH